MTLKKIDQTTYFLYIHMQFFIAKINAFQLSTVLHTTAAVYIFCTNSLFNPLIIADTIL